MLDERLSLAAALYEPCGLGADIGADHALLPCHLLEQGVCERMILTDLSPKALSRAGAEVRRRGLENRVSLRCGDGLSVLREKCGCISVTGMGGRTIAAMLTEGRERLLGAVLVICAHTEQAETRLCLRDIGYRIVREEPCVCAGHAYVIWRAEPGREAPYTPEEAQCGRLLFRSGSPMLHPYAEIRLSALERRLAGLRAAAEPDKAAVAETLGLIRYYRERLPEIRSARPTDGGKP